jgi:hypothetical protein
MSEQHRSVGKTLSILAESLHAGRSRSLRVYCRESSIRRYVTLALLAIALAWLPVTPAAASSRTWFLNNSVSISMNSGDPGAMVAKFTPAGGLTLQQAANIAGFDHFNWLQTITGLPAGWTLEQVSKAGVVSALTTPIYDPLENSADYKLQIRTASGTTEVVALQTGFLDKNPCYWGEDWSRWYEPGNLFGTPTVVYSSTLLFADRPSMPSSIMGPNDFISFETRLVGVTADGTIDLLNDTAGTSFQWKTNAQTDSVIFDDAILGAIPSGTLPSLVVGAVFDAHVVPEPSTIVLLSIGAVCSFAFAWRRRWRQ